MKSVMKQKVCCVARVMGDPSLQSRVRNQFVGIRFWGLGWSVPTSARVTTACDAQNGAAVAIEVRLVEHCDVVW